MAFNLSSAQQHRVTVRIRLVWMPITSHNTAFRRNRVLRPLELAVPQEHLDAVLAAFKIKLAFDYSFTNHTGYAVLREGIGSIDRSDSFCIFRRNKFVVAWAQDGQSKTLKAVIVAPPNRRTRLEEMMDHQRDFTTHPLFLGLIVAILEGAYLEDGLIDADSKITQIENRTGYHPWAIDEDFETAEGDYPITFCTDKQRFHKSGRAKDEYQILTWITVMDRRNKNDFSTAKRGVDSLYRYHESAS